jgi:hypothetical protein
MPMFAAEDNVLWRLLERRSSCGKVESKLRMCMCCICHQHRFYHRYNRKPPACSISMCVHRDCCRQEASYCNAVTPAQTVVPRSKKTRMQQQTAHAALTAPAQQRRTQHTSKPAPNFALSIVRDTSKVQHSLCKGRMQARPQGEGPWGQLGAVGVGELWWPVRLQTTMAGR